MTLLQTLQQRAHETMRQASREYIRERVTGQRRQERRETDAEIREAISGGTGNAMLMSEREP